MLVAIKVLVKLCVIQIGGIISLPILLYRCILSRVALSFWSLEIVDPASSCILAEDFYYDKTFTSMIIIEMQPGKRMELSDLRHVFQQKFSNKMKYQKLRSSVIQWMGYLFWKKDTKFNLNGHVLDFNDLAMPQPDWASPNVVDQLVSILLQNRPWRKDRALWEAVLINNDRISSESHKSVIIIKYHHGLMDGFAAYNTFGHLLGNLEEFGTKAIPITGTVGFDVPLKKVGILKHIANMAKIIVDIWNYFYATEAINGRNLPMLNKDGKQDIQVISHKGNLQDIRMAKRKQGVDFNSMLVAGIATFYRTLLTSNGHVPYQDASIGVTLIMPGHPGTMCNHIALLNLVLPLRESDGLKRLHIISQQMRKLTTSQVPLCLFMLLKWLGSLPHPLVKLIRSRRLFFTSHFVATNLGGPAETCSIGQFSMGRFMCAMNRTLHGPAFKIALMTYKGDVHVTACAMNEFIPEDGGDHKRVRLALAECFKEWKVLGMNN